MNELRIDPKWRWAAMDRDGTWYVYDDDVPPKKGARGWGWINDFEAVTDVFTLNKHIDWRDSLHEIIHEDGRAYLRKHVDIPADGEPVMVLFRGDWEKKYSAGLIDQEGCIACYRDGKTKWSSGGVINYFLRWRRPTPEELEG